jgi:hypothetical protein
MGRGERQDKDGFTQVMGRRRGLVGSKARSAFPPHALQEMIEDVSEGRVQRVVERLQNSGPGPHAEPLVEALAARKVTEVAERWEGSVVLFTAAMLGFTKRKGAWAIGLPGVRVRRSWEEGSRDLCAQRLMEALDAGEALRPDAICARSCRRALAHACAQRAHTEGETALERICGRPALERALGSWPPKRGLAAIWGPGDWEPILMRRLPEPEGRGLPSDRQAVLSEATRQRKRVAQDLLGALARAERRGSPTPPEPLQP